MGKIFDEKVKAVAEMADTLIDLTTKNFELMDDRKKLFQKLLKLESIVLTLISENAGLSAENERLKAALYGIRTDSAKTKAGLRRKATKALTGHKPHNIACLEHQIEELKALLVTYQWSGGSTDKGHCPSCRGAVDKGHYKDCSWAALTLISTSHPLPDNTQAQGSAGEGEAK